MAKRRDQGDGSVTKREGRRRPYQAQIDLGRDGSGKRRRRTLGYFKTKTEANRALRKALETLDSGGRIADPGLMTVSDLVQLYLSSKEEAVEPTTLGTYRSTLNKHLVPRLGGMQIKRVTDAHIESLKNDMRDAGVGLRTRRMVLDLAARVFELAVRRGKLAANPTAHVDRPKLPRPEIAHLTPQEAQHLLAVARDTQPPWVEAALALGLCSLRRGEVFGLRWGDIDLGAGRVRLAQALKETAQGRQYIADLKTKMSRRTVPLPSWARQAVNRHRESLPASPHPTVLVFTSGAGTPIRFSNWGRRNLRPVVAAAGLQGKKVSLQPLRHTAATLVLGGGTDLKTTQAMLGHSRASTTLDIYAKHIPENLETAMAGLDAMIAGADDSGA
ncbi:MAG: tyrosine-type recombinase/integrase [Myxococcota bacterium]